MEEYKLKVKDGKYPYKLAMDNIVMTHLYKAIDEDTGEILNIAKIDINKKRSKDFDIIQYVMRHYMEENGNKEVLRYMRDSIIFDGESYSKKSERYDKLRPEVDCILESIDSPNLNNLIGKKSNIHILGLNENYRFGYRDNLFYNVTQKEYLYGDFFSDINKLSYSWNKKQNQLFEFDSYDPLYNKMVDMIDRNTLDTYIQMDEDTSESKAPNDVSIIYSYKSYADAKEVGEQPFTPDGKYMNVIDLEDEENIEKNRKLFLDVYDTKPEESGFFEGLSNIKEIHAEDIEYAVPSNETGNPFMFLNIIYGFSFNKKQHRAITKHVRRVNAYSKPDYPIILDFNLKMKEGSEYDNLCKEYHKFHKYHINKLYEDLGYKYGDLDKYVELSWDDNGAYDIIDTSSLYDGLVQLKEYMKDIDFKYTLDELLVYGLSIKNKKTLEERQFNRNDFVYYTIEMIDMLTEFNKKNESNYKIAALEYKYGYMMYPYVEPIDVLHEKLVSVRVQSIFNTARATPFRYRIYDFKDKETYDKLSKLINRGLFRYNGIEDSYEEENMVNSHRHYMYCVDGNLKPFDNGIIALLDDMDEMTKGHQMVYFCN